jgi:hypothetical protein
MARIQAGSKSGDSNQVGATRLEKNNEALFPGRVPHVRQSVHGPKKMGRSPFQRFSMWQEDPAGTAENAGQLNAGSACKEIYIQVLLYEIKMHGIYISMNTVALTLPQGVVVRGIVGRRVTLPSPWRT